MRRGGSNANGRVSSPTNTTYSGISSYRMADSTYKQPQSQTSLQDTREVARIHYEELSVYLASYLANEPANSRSAARQKLTRLTRQQFQELSTDVYDELIRRKKNADSNDVPFLPVRDDFHPKRNQARQKLATLPTSRFKDLSSDVYYELVRRYPEFKEQAAVENPMESPGSAYDDFPSPDFPAAARSNQPDAPDAKAYSQNGGGKTRVSLPTSPQLPPTPFTGSTNYTDYPSPPPLARNSQDQYSPVPAEIPRRRQAQDDFGPSSSSSSRRKPSDEYSVSSRRRPSDDYRRPNDEFATTNRRPSGSSNGTGTSGTNANLATSGMIIPAKSTIAEEEIEMPFSRRGARGDPDDDDLDLDEDGRNFVRRGGSISGGRSTGISDGDEDGRDYYDKVSAGRGSVASERGVRSGSDREKGGGSDNEKVRREYEFRIATMQSKIISLEREAEERVSLIDEYRRREERDTVERERMADDNKRLQDQCRTLQSQLENSNSRAGRQDRNSVESAALIEQLRSDTEELLGELADVSARNDELISARELDAQTIRDLESQVRDWKKKHESAKTELRSIKATSQLYSAPKPSFTDGMPTSSLGGVADIHITAFLASVDALLVAGRSNSPTRVLTPMKAVVNAVTAIVDDLRVYSQSSSSSAIRPDELDTLRDRAEATLVNLVAAAKMHATSSGMAPVSLLDAAASHVAATVSEIGRTVLVRRATKSEQDAFATSSLSSANMSSPLLQGFDDLRGHQRLLSQSSFSSRNLETQTTRPLSGRSLGRQSSSGRSASPIFDPPIRGNSDDSLGITEGSEEAWAELKPYLEAQTESIVYAIQSVLSGVRSPTPSPTLTENLTQIITIVSSIVAVCNDALPPGNIQGRNLLDELSDHANRLSETLSLPEVTKESRQIMAKSSFAIANAMKGLQKI